MIAKEYEATFGDFSFEKNIPELITTLESYWLKLKEKYHWNYSSRGVNKDHFALDVKIHVWPNADKMREILEDPDLGEEEVEHKWYHWLNERAEMFIDQIDHAWIKDAGFAGKSGGWLFIYPVVDDEDFGN
ncbi:MAG: hypothetical protein WCG06_05200, partial [Candidatus Omnitrophota bacterium]